jgi:3-oxoacyl-[acyl-carrier-protein] synthase II
MRIDGADLTRLLRDLLERTGVRPRDVDLVDVHGTSTRINDEAEARALLSVFGDHTCDLTVTAHKRHFGHSLGAASALELVCVCAILADGVAPPQPMNYPLDSLVRFRLCRDRATVVRRAIKIASSFAGIHSAIMLCAPQAAS